MTHGHGLSKEAAPNKRTDKGAPRGLTEASLPLERRERVPGCQGALGTVKRMQVDYPYLLRGLTTSLLERFGPMARARCVKKEEFKNNAMIDHLFVCLERLNGLKSSHGACVGA